MNALAHVDNTNDDLPKQKEIDKLKKEVSELESKLAESRGKLGSTYKTAENDHGIHPQAFKLVQRLGRMDESKCAAFLRHFDHYRRKMLVETEDMFPEDQDNVVDLKSRQSKPMDEDAAEVLAETDTEIDDDLIESVTDDEPEQND